VIGFVFFAFIGSLSFFLPIWQNRRAAAKAANWQPQAARGANAVLQQDAERYHAKQQAYDEVAQMVGREEAACRQLYSRAKKHIVEHRPRFKPSPEAHRQILNQFLQATRTGELVGMYADMERMETLVTNSPLDWTIVRPSGLFATVAVTDYKVAEAVIRGMYTSRADLADCMLKQLTTDRNVRKIVAVATVSEQPNMFKLIATEAFQKRPG
jgi:hypothetical protein